MNLAIQEEGFIGYDEVGQPMTTVITREYDLTGQVTRESIDNNYSYIDLNSNQVAVSTPFQRDLVYNSRGWLVEERHFVWGDPNYQGKGYITINYDYDHLGNRIKITDANGDVTKYEYDGLKRPIKEYWSISDIQNPGGYLDVLKNEYQYDGVGNKVIDIDANGNITRYTYDPLNRLKEVIVGGYVTRYEYDKVGNLLGVIFPKTSEISYEYDNAGNQIKFIDQLGNITGYTYYANNLLKTITDRKGQVTTYSYDARGLLTSVENPDGTISYLYDDAGNRIEMIDSTGTTFYTYDGAGNLKATEKGDYVVQYFYDHLGNRIKTIDPDNITIYGYDPLSRLQRVQTYLPGGETTYRYDLAGRRIELQYPNGTYTTYEYTPFGWLECLTNRDANTILSQYTYSYDAKCNQLTKRNLDGSKAEYEYDDLDQLIEEAYYLPGETTPWKVISYTYDEVGNRATKLVREQGKTDEITRYHYDAANRLIGEDIYL